MYVNYNVTHKYHSPHIDLAQANPSEGRMHKYFTCFTGVISGNGNHTAKSSQLVSCWYLIQLQPRASMIIPADVRQFMQVSHTRK